MNPREFYDSHVIQNYNMWVADHSNRAKAMNTVSELNNMVEYFYNYLKRHTPNLTYTNPRAYRIYLAKQECPDFQIVWDVADGHKHIELNRMPRQVTRSDQTRTASLKWRDDPTATWQELNFPWSEAGDIFLVTLDSGGKRILRVAVDRVLAMWERLLCDVGL